MKFSLGWVDFSDEDRNKTLDLFRNLEIEGSVDEIGYGVIRDRFADYFFPGTSTIQTRAKYFLIVPYVVSELIKKIKNNKELSNESLVIEELHRQEKKCAVEMLKKLYDDKADKVCIEKKKKAKIIGADNLISDNRVNENRRWVVRNPSEIYWAGIRKLGIFKEDLSLKELFRSILNKDSSFEEYYVSKDNKNDLDLIENNPPNLFSLPPSYIGLAEDDFFSNLCIDLTEEERVFLLDKIKENCENSLLKVVIEFREREIDLLSPQIESKTDDVSEFELFAKNFIKYDQGQESDLLKVLEQAVAFDKFLYPIRVFYSFLVAEAHDLKEYTQKYKDEWKSFFYSDSLFNYADNCRLDDIYSFFQKQNTAVSPKTQKFFSDIRCLFIENYNELKNQEIDSCSRVYEALRKIISERELFLKTVKERCKINKDYPIKKISIDHLNYRLPIASQIIRDLFLEGECNGDK